jgi:hypothetical protein
MTMLLTVLLFSTSPTLSAAVLSWPAWLVFKLSLAFRSVKGCQIRSCPLQKIFGQIAYVLWAFVSEDRLCYSAVSLLSCPLKSVRFTKSLGALPNPSGFEDELQQSLNTRI